MTAWKRLARRGFRRLSKPFAEGIGYYFQRRRLNAAFWYLREFPKARGSLDSLLSSKYREYISQVSSDAAAISLPLAELLFYVCHETKPTSILDLGSGFSSYVFRLHQKSNDPSCLVYSVDTDQDWLVETKKFCERSGLSTSCLLPWPAFLKEPVRKFDLILHDLGGNGMEFRAETLASVLERCHPQTLIFLDDMHKPHYRQAVELRLKKAQAKVYDLKPYTYDRYERYSWLVTGIPQAVTSSNEHP